MAGTIHQSDYRLAFCRKRWRRRLNDDDDDDDGDYVDGMLMMVVMVTVMLIILLDPTRKICNNFGSSRLTCFSLEWRRRTAMARTQAGEQDRRHWRPAAVAAAMLATAAASALETNLKYLKDAVSVLQTLVEQDADPAADDTSDAPEGMAPQKVWRRGRWVPVCIETESLSLKRSEVVVEGPEDECTPKMKRLKLLPRE